VGAGALPDAPNYGDSGSNTLGNLAHAFREKSGRTLNLPHFQSLGLSQITPLEGVAPAQKIMGAFGKAREKSFGKDTTSGHWEMAGLVVTKPFAVYPQGFPQNAIERWCQENQLPGVLGNKSASGTEILVELGEEHVRTGKPILYTSADSVWQVAAHEDVIPLDRLNAICKSARKICDEMQIGRVISRPFIGNPAQGKPFTRTYNRKDYAQLPSTKTFLDHLCDEGISTLGIGKISNIYAGKGIQKNIDTKGNADGMRVVTEQLTQTPSGLIYCNLIDFDMLYGHRRDVLGFGQAMEALDATLPGVFAKLLPTDLLIFASDHGNDPTFRGTDHTREYIPLMAYSPAFKDRARDQGGIHLEERDSFGDVGATVYSALTGKNPHFSDLRGESFLQKLVQK